MLHFVVRMTLAFLDFFFVYLFITRGPRWQNNRTVELERTTQDGEHGWCGSFLLKKTHYRIIVQMGPGPLGLKTTTHTLWLHSLFPFGDLMMMPPSGHLHISRLMMHLFTYLPMYLGKLDPVLRLWSPGSARRPYWVVFREHRKCIYLVARYKACYPWTSWRSFNVPKFV